MPRYAQTARWLALAALTGCQAMMAVDDPTVHTGPTVTLECASCHLPDYDQTSMPAHKAAGYPTTCASCHEKAAWIPAKGGGPHTFPIDSGKHQGVPCASCHTDPKTNSTFSCISGGCHPLGDVGGDHDEVGGFKYESSACYSCHPDGKE